MTVPLDTVNDIRSMDAAGRSRSEIARMLHVSRNTVAKYADMEDMSPAAPMPQRRGRPALEGNEEWVAGVLEADLGLATLMRTVPGGALETGARPGGRAHRQGPPARHRRARVSPARRGRGEAALPGFHRCIREAVGGNHHESRVQQVGSVFGDDQMAAAVIDRIVHHGRLVQFRGESYRDRHALIQEG